MTRFLIGTVASLCMATGAVAEGALAIDSNQGDQWGWSAGYSSSAQAQKVALAECGLGCEVVVTYEYGCAAYAADQASGSTVYGYSYNYATRAQAEERAMFECTSRNGSQCIIRVWGCH